jgi:hypothetical protein
MCGYDHVLAGGEHTELDSWSGKKVGRLTAKEATQRWFVKSRTLFSLIKADEF